MPWISLACLLTFVGVFGLYLQWRSRRKSPLKNLLFWTALVFSVYCWSLFAGIEFGVIYGLGYCGVVALLLTIATADYSDVRADIRKYPKHMAVARRVWLRNAGYLILALPLAGLAATVTTTWLSSLFMAQATNHIVLVYLLVPMVWGVLAFIVCSHRNLFRGAALLALFCIIPGAGLMWL